MLMCIPIGMNTAIILLVLLLAVPLQLFLSHYINTSYSGSDAPADSGEAAEPIRGDINSVRIEAMNRYTSRVYNSGGRERGDSPPPPPLRKSPF